MEGGKVERWEREVAKPDKDLDSSEHPKLATLIDTNLKSQC